MSDYAKLKDSMRILGWQLSSTAATTPRAEDKVVLERYRDTLAAMLTYTESLRTAARAVLRKSAQRGGVPGLTAEFMSLQSAHDGAMTFLDGESLP